MMITRLHLPGFLLLSAAIFFTVKRSEALSCGPCGGVGFCPDPPICANGLVPDMCKCCMVCGKGEGEQCGGPWDMLGACGDNLVCVKFQSYPSSSAYPRGKCRYHPTKKPKVVEGENSNGTTTAIPTTTTTKKTTNTVTSSTEVSIYEDSSLNEVVNYKALTYREWVLRQFWY